MSLSKARLRSSCLLVGIASTLLMIGCGSKKLGSPTLGKPATAGWPAYSKSTAAGKVFGKSWKGSSAVLRPFQSDNKQVSLDIYAQTNGDVCKSAMASDQPVASVVLPAALSKKEYVADMSQPGSGNPLMFIDMSSSKNVMAEKTKVRVNQIHDWGLNVSVYAYGRDVDGSVSEINGVIDVTDCSKAVEFSAWEDLAGMYDLISFDGKAVSNSRMAVFDMKNDEFFDRVSDRWVRALMIPLYAHVGENSDSSYDFGVMQGLGNSTLKQSGDQQIYTYAYKGPIYTAGQDIKMDLSLKIVRKDREMQVEYTLEVEKYVKRTTHSFVVRK